MLEKSLWVLFQIFEIINVGFGREMKNVELVDMLRIIPQEKGQVVSIESIEL